MKKILSAINDSSLVFEAGRAYGVKDFPVSRQLAYYWVKAGKIKVTLYGGKKHVFMGEDIVAALTAHGIKAVLL